MFAVSVFQTHPVAILYVVVQLFPMLMGAWVFKRLNNEGKLFWIFTIFDGIISLLQYSLAWNTIRNLWVGNIYDLAEYGCCVWLFSRWIENRAVKLAFRMSIIAYAVMWAVIVLWLSGFNERDMSLTFITKATLLATAAYTLYERSQNTDRNLFQEFEFMTTATFFLYWSATTVIILVRQILIYQDSPVEERLRFYIVGWIISIVLNLCLTYAMWLASRNRVESVAASGATALQQARW
jgi:hypothetical protein